MRSEVQTPSSPSVFFPSCTPTVLASERASRAQEEARKEGGQQPRLRVRTGVVFHKAALKVSWQPPAARLCKETTETSRSAEQQPLRCPDFLRNLNELFVKNHWSCLQAFSTAKTSISVKWRSHFICDLDFFCLTLYFYRFCYKHGAGKGEEFDNKLWLS